MMTELENATKPTKQRLVRCDTVHRASVQPKSHLHRQTPYSHVRILRGLTVFQPNCTSVHVYLLHDFGRLGYRLIFWPNPFYFRRSDKVLTKILTRIFSCL